MRTVFLSGLAPCVLALSPSSQGSVFVVDDDAGPGVDFGSIQAAVDAAGPGDVVLVREGAYLPFTVAGKGLTVVGDDGASVVIEGPMGVVATVVSAIPAGQQAVLRNLVFRPPLNVDGDLVRLESSPGVIWLEEVDLEFILPFPFGYFMNQRQALRIEDCDRVVLTRMDVNGLDGATQGQGLETASIPLSAVSSSVYAFDCIFDAAFGQVLQGEGQTGVELVDSFLSARSSVLQGGPGGIGSFFMGLEGGVGGPGADLSAGSELWLIDSFAVGGPGGSNGIFPSGPDGPPTKSDATSAVFEHVASPVSFQSPGLSDDGSDTDIFFDVDTDPGSMVLLLAEFEADPVFVSAFADAVATGLAPVILPLGTTDAAGQLTFFLEPPELPAALDTFDYVLQIAVLTPTTGLELSNPTLFTLVQEGF